MLQYKRDLLNSNLFADLPTVDETGNLTEISFSSPNCFAWLMNNSNPNKKLTPEGVSFFVFFYFTTPITTPSSALGEQTAIRPAPVVIMKYPVPSES